MLHVLPYVSVISVSFIHLYCRSYGTHWSTFGKIRHLRMTRIKKSKRMQTSEQTEAHTLDSWLLGFCDSITVESQAWQKRGWDALCRQKLVLIKRIHSDCLNSVQLCIFCVSFANCLLITQSDHKSTLFIHQIIYQNKTTTHMCFSMCKAEIKPSVALIVFNRLVSLGEETTGKSALDAGVYCSERCFCW